MFKSVQETIKAAHSSKATRLQIKFFKLDKATSLAAALREIHESNIKLEEDFIIMQGDIVSNACLQDAIDMHMSAKKSKGKDGGEGASVIMTKIFSPVPFANPVRDPSQELALLLDQETRQIIDYGQTGASGTSSY